MKVNAAITVVEYTLTFLVSVTALVTFVADRYPALDTPLLGMQSRTIVAVALSAMVGWLVNRGPKMAARCFGPATFGVLLLLWAMVAASVVRFGLRLPDFQIAAFHPGYLHFTLSGYAHILALMTGIEVFANLVAAYQGTPERKSRKAFGSLTIIMGTTLATMLIVGPAILSSPTHPTSTYRCSPRPWTGCCRGHCHMPAHCWEWSSSHPQRRPAPRGFRTWPSGCAIATTFPPS